MNIKEHTHPDKLERYSFLWSELRLLIAALALFIGGYPPVLAFNPIPSLYGLLSSLLTLSWIISGAAALYLLYRWNLAKRLLFGKKDTLDTTAFFVMIISGINLGLVGVLHTNIGMSISSSPVVFFIVALAYIASAGHLLRRWKANGRKVF